jgi:DNA-binding SARP family transcriptional activator
MVNVKLNLLGPPEIFIDGEPISLSTRKSVALLAYLAVTESAHSRDSLAALLWPEHDQTRARTYLRQAFHAFTKFLGSTNFQADRQRAL